MGGIGADVLSERRARSAWTSLKTAVEIRNVGDRPLTACRWIS
jgi:ribosome biogenesis SPOUT family RNA methylase Rps3